MKLTRDIYNDIISNFELIDTQVVELKNMAKMLDRELVKCYHEIEVSNANASEGYMFYKKLKDILQTRRIVKMELGSLEKVQKLLPLQKTADYKMKKGNIEHCLETYGYNLERDYLQNFKASIEDIKAIV